MGFFGLRRVRALLAGVFLLGLGVRVVHCLAIAGTAFPEFPSHIIDDSNVYHSWAGEIAAGNVWGDPPYQAFKQGMEEVAPLETWEKWWGGGDRGRGRKIFRTAPFYPYFVAALETVSSGSMRFVLLAQILLGAALPLVVFALARRAFDERAALCAAAISAVYGPFVFNSGLLLRDWLPPLLHPILVVALLRAGRTLRAADGFRAGAILGLAILVKETAYLFLPLAVLWLWLESRRRKAPARPATLDSKPESPIPNPQSARPVLVLFFLSGTLAGLSPLLLRNSHVGAPLFSISNRGPQAFIRANVLEGHPVGRRRHSLNPAELKSTFKRIMEKTDGRLLPVMAETLRTYDGQRSLILQKALLKVRGILDPHEICGEGMSYYFGMEISPVLRGLPGFGILLPLGAAGFFLAAPFWRRHLLLHLYLLAALAGLLYAMIHDRYRLVLIPLLAAYAGFALVRTWDAAARREWGPLAGVAGLIALLGLFQWAWAPVFPAEEYVNDFAGKTFAEIYAEQGRFDRAAAEIERFKNRKGKYPLEAWEAGEVGRLLGNHRAAWARKLAGEGRMEEARREAERAREALGPYLGEGDPYYNLGRLALDLGEKEKGRECLERALSLKPDAPWAPEARRLLANLEEGGPKK